MVHDVNLWDLLKAHEDVAVDLLNGKVYLVLPDRPPNVRKNLLWTTLCMTFSRLRP